jgi:non-heme chloroperoxidase
MAMTDEIKRISANGTVFAYVEFGQGEPVIFVHGGQCFCQGVFTQSRPKGDIRLGHLSKSRREVLRATGRRNPHIVGGSPQAYP